MNKIDFMVYVPIGSKVFHIMQGTGDNLLDEDIEEGFVDYIDYEVFRLGLVDGDPELTEDDGGMVLLREPYADYSIGDIVRRCLDMAGYEVSYNMYPAFVFVEQEVE